MKLWTKVRMAWEELAQGKPGERFQTFTAKKRERRGKRSWLRRFGMLAGGTALIVVGLAIGWLPGPGGFLAFVGLAMIAIEVPIAAQALDVGEVKLRGGYNMLRNMLRRLFMRSRKRT